MRRKRYVALDQIPDPGPDPEETILQAAAQKAEKAKAARIARKALDLKAQLLALNRDDQALVAAFLMDDDVAGRPWGRLSSAEVADLFDRTANWVRVAKFLMRREYPCSGGPSSCGKDQPACAHARGRKVFYRAVIKALNRPKE